MKSFLGGDSALRLATCLPSSTFVPKSLPVPLFFPSVPRTWEGTARPPGTPRFCWYLCALRCRRAGTGAAHRGKASVPSLSVWRRGHVSRKEKGGPETSGCRRSRFAPDKRDRFKVEGGSRGCACAYVCTCVYIRDVERGRRGPTSWCPRW